MALMQYGLDSEFKPLKTILLYRPGPEIGNHPDPHRILHLHPIDHAGLSGEYDRIISTFTSLGVKVLMIDQDLPLAEDRDHLYNMMYCRDLLFMTPAGAILSSMAHTMRQGEVPYAARTLSANDIPVLATVTGPGKFEGADALWIDDRTVAIGIGNRTNKAGFRQVSAILKTQGIDAIPLPSKQRVTQHLLGTVQIVAQDLALVRHEIADPRIIDFLTDRNFTIIKIPEHREVLNKQAMNIVTVAPRTLVMPSGCPAIKAIYQQAGLTIGAELDLTQLIKGAGGLACATGIVARC